MLKIENLNHNQKFLLESWLSKDLTKLPDELKQIDKLLNDDTFIEPFIEKFNKRFGRPTVPVKSYI